MARWCSHSIERWPSVLVSLRRIEDSWNAKKKWAKKQQQHMLSSSDRAHYWFLCSKLNYKLIESFPIHLVLYAPFATSFSRLLFPLRLLPVSNSSIARRILRDSVLISDKAKFLIHHGVQVASINFASTYWIRLACEQGWATGSSHFFYASTSAMSNCTVAIKATHTHNGRQKTTADNIL